MGAGYAVPPIIFFRCTLPFQFCWSLVERSSDLILECRARNWRALAWNSYPGGLRGVIDASTVVQNWSARGDSD
jgi:hypothetical protein